MFFKIYNEARYPTAIGDASAKKTNHIITSTCAPSPSSSVQC